MPVIELRSRIPVDGDDHARILAESMEATISGERGGSHSFNLEVREGSAALSIAITAAGDQPIDTAPKGLQKVTIFDAFGSEVSGGILRGPGGHVVYVMSDPTPGSWRINVEYSEDADLEVNAAAVVSEFFEYLMKPVVRCNGCRATIKAIGLAILLTAVLSVGPVTASFIAAKIGLGPEALKFILEYAALDGYRKSAARISTYLCQRLGFCPA